MRVLHIGLSSIMGGIESFSLNYFSKMSEEGYIFDYADIYGAGIAGADRIEMLGGRVIRLPNFKRHPVRFTITLVKLLKAEQYDAVHINIQTAANILPVIAAYLAGIVPVVHAHTVNATGALRAFLHSVNLPLLRRLPAIRVACSEESGKWLWGKHSFSVIPNAIDLNKFVFSRDVRDTIRNKLGIDDNTILLGFVGRLEPVKNPMYAIQIIESYRKRFPDSSIKLVVLGQGTLLPRIEEELERAGIHDLVRLEGLRPNVNEYLSALDVFLMPSLHEALSLAAVEAQANGLCCLFSDSIARELRIIENAVFLPLGQVDLWIDKIHDLAGILDCGRINASEVVEKTDYNINKSSKALADIYNQTVERNRK